MNALWVAWLQVTKNNWNILNIGSNPVLAWIFTEALFSLLLKCSLLHYLVCNSHTLLYSQSVLLLITISDTCALLTKHKVKMVGHWPSSIFAFLWTKTKSRSIKTHMKRTKLVSNHLDWTILVNKGSWSICFMKNHEFLVCFKRREKKPNFFVNWWESLVFFILTVICHLLL